MGVAFKGLRVSDVYGAQNGPILKPKRTAGLRVRGLVCSAQTRDDPMKTKELRGVQCSRVGKFAVISNRTLSEVETSFSVRSGEREAVREENHERLVMERVSEGSVTPDCVYSCSSGLNEDVKTPKPEEKQIPNPFAGTIPKLIVTHDDLSSGHGDLTLSMGGFSLDLHPDEDSPCSDSGCGGSPAPFLFHRKLSSSSSAGLSSASSFEESEDDFTGSDIEPSSLSPSMCNMFGSPEELAGVGISFSSHFECICTFLART